jgi:hypothetical protein
MSTTFYPEMGRPDVPADHDKRRNQVTTVNVPKSLWQRYEELAADESTRTSDRFQSAGTYANTMETSDTTDEQWAEAFWNAWNNWA